MKEFRGTVTKISRAFVQHRLSVVNLLAYLLIGGQLVIGNALGSHIPIERHAVLKALSLCPRSYEAVKCACPP